MPDVNMSVFEEAQRNQLVIEVDIQTQVALDDYQVKLSGIANPTQSQDNVVIDGHGKFLSHWNESLDFDTWVKMSMEVAGKRLLMLRGNSSISDVSNGSTVFPDLFKDFEDDDLSDWNKDAFTAFVTSTDFAVSGTKSLKVYWSGAGYRYASLPLTNLDTDHIIEYDMLEKTGNNYPIRMHIDDASKTSSGIQISSIIYANPYRITYLDRSAVHQNIVTGLSSNTWYHIAINPDVTADTFDCWWDYSESLIVNNGEYYIVSSANSYFTFVLGKSTAITSTIYIDNLRIRKYTSTEPNVTIGTSKNIATALKSLGRAG